MAVFFTRLVLIVFLASVCNDAAAGLITSESHPVFGANSLTRDHTQQLDFLDLPFSDNRSFNELQGQFGPGSGEFGVGGDFEGFRYATEAEVIALIVNAGFGPDPTLNAYNVGNAPDQLSTLSEMLGRTNASDTQFLNLGMTSTERFGNVKEVLIRDFKDSTDPDVVDLRFTQSKSQGVTTLSSFLVIPSAVAAVPEPSSAALFAVGVIAAVIRRRRV